MAYTRDSEGGADHEARMLTLGADDNTRFTAARYPVCDLPREAWPWGVMKQSRYPDRPDLGWLHGGFVWR